MKFGDYKRKDDVELIVESEVKENNNEENIKIKDGDLNKIIVNYYFFN